MYSNTLREKLQEIVDDVSLLRQIRDRIEEPKEILALTRAMETLNDQALQAYWSRNK